MSIVETMTFDHAKRARACRPEGPSRSPIATRLPPRLSGAVDRSGELRSVGARFRGRVV